MKKLINAKFIRTNESGKSCIINVELDNGTHKHVLFPVSQVSFEDMKYGDKKPTGSIYVEDWILKRKEQELGAYITNEDA